jgi:hypothetical protein
MDQPGAFSTVSVCVIRRNLAGVGSNAIDVVWPAPLPSATVFHDVPSIDTSTL